MRARLRSGQLKRLKKVGIRRRDKEGAEQLGLARLDYLDAASPLHTRMTEVVPLRTVVTAELRASFSNGALWVRSVTRLGRSPYPRAGWPLGNRRRKQKDPLHGRPWLSMAAYPMRLPPPQASQLEPEPLVERMPETIRAAGAWGISLPVGCNSRRRIAPMGPPTNARPLHRLTLLTTCATLPPSTAGLPSTSRRSANE